MASPHISMNDTVEFNSACHRVFDLNKDIIKSNIYQPSHTPMLKRGKPRVGAVWTEPGFTTEMAYSGTAGTPAQTISKLLTAVGMSTVNTPATSDVYTWDGTMASALGLIIDCYLGNGVKISSTGAIGNLQMQFRPDQPIMNIWNLFGLYAAPTEASGSAALSTDPNPDVCNNMPITIGGVSLQWLELDINLNVETDSPNLDMSDVATQGCRLPNQTASANGGIPTFTTQVVLPDFASVNYWTEFLAENAAALALGTKSVTAGEMIDVAMTGYMNAAPVPEDGPNGKTLMRCSYEQGTGSGEPLVISMT